MSNNSSTIQAQSLKDASKDLILHTSMELFASKGYHKTSVLSIAKEIGISSGLIFYHFETKDNLLKEVIISLLNKMDAIFEIEEGVAADKKLGQIIDRFKESLLQNKSDWELYMAIIYQPDTKALIEPLVTQSTRKIRRIIYEIYKLSGHPKPDEVSLKFELFRIGVFSSFLYTGNALQLEKSIVLFKNQFIIN